MRLALLALLVACKQDDRAAPTPAPEPVIAVPGGAVQPIDAAIELAPDAAIVAVVADAAVDEGATKTVGAARPKRGAPPVDAAVDAPPVAACNCTPPSASTKERSRDAANHLRSEQGALRVTGTEVTLTAAAGWHIATDYNIKLYLEPGDGVHLAHAPLTAGGRTKASGDATVLSEQTMTFRIAARGKGTIEGILSFGICEADSCHPRLQPITISVAAN